MPAEQRISIVRNPEDSPNPKEKYPSVFVGVGDEDESWIAPFFMAFCFLPEGIKIICGSYERINKYVKENYKTPCHAFLWFQSRGVTSIQLLGNVGNLKLERVRNNRVPVLDQDIKDKILREIGFDRHTRYVLYSQTHNHVTGKEFITVIRTWRKMPKKYLKELGFAHHPVREKKDYDRYEYIVEEVEKNA